MMYGQNVCVMMKWNTCCQHAVEPQTLVLHYHSHSFYKVTRDFARQAIFVSLKQNQQTVACTKNYRKKPYDIEDNNSNKMMVWVQMLLNVPQLFNITENTSDILSHLCHEIMSNFIPKNFTSIMISPPPFLGWNSIWYRFLLLIIKMLCIDVWINKYEKWQRFTPWFSFYWAWSPNVSTIVDWKNT